MRLYRAVAARGEPVVARRLSRAVAQGLQSEPMRMERLGHAGGLRPSGPLIWLHASRRDKAAAGAQMLSRLRRSFGPIGAILTSESPADLPEDAEAWIRSALRPCDTLPTARRFLDAWRPDLMILTGPRVWPAAASEAVWRGAEVIFLEADVPSTSAGGLLQRIAARQVLPQFHRHVARDCDARDRLVEAGVAPDRIEVVGAFEESSAPLPCNEAERDQLVDLLSARPVWLAAGLTETELDEVMAAHSVAIRHAHRLLLIVVPEDPDSGLAVADRCQAKGWMVGVRSDGAEPDSDQQVYVADTNDEMGLWLRLAPIVFLGRSLTRPGGGQSPYAAASLGSAIIHGPHIGAHRPAYARFAAAGAARRVASGEVLGATVARLLSPDKAAEMAHAAWDVSSRGATATDRVVEIVSDALDRVG